MSRTDRYDFTYSNSYALFGFGIGVNTILEKAAFCFLHEYDPNPFIVLSNTVNDFNCVQLDFRSDGLHVKSICYLDKHTIAEIKIEDKIYDVQTTFVEYLKRNGGEKFIYKKEVEWLNTNSDESKLFVHDHSDDKRNWTIGSNGMPKQDVSCVR